MKCCSTLASTVSGYAAEICIIPVSTPEIRSRVSIEQPFTRRAQRRDTLRECIVWPVLFFTGQSGAQLFYACDIPWSEGGHLHRWYVGRRINGADKFYDPMRYSVQLGRQFFVYLLLSDYKP